ncbi:TPA: hypothetical protein ACN31N_000906 [Vibrio parahaemolyticus]|uniref:hypothetical protein n=1 Tax=Vibrio parahaemolyticus TaxID=670 RepID=UPI0015DF31C0|nr:hypothetical protein [Vibrio parahaemolyticus]
MQNCSPKTTYQFVVDLEEEKLATAKTLEEQVNILNHFRAMRDAVYQREWESFNTAA